MSTDHGMPAAAMRPEQFVAGFGRLGHPTTMARRSDSGGQSGLSDAVQGRAAVGPDKHGRPPRSANTPPWRRRSPKSIGLSAQMVRTGAPSDAVELIVVDDADEVIKRPRAS